MLTKLFSVSLLMTLLTSHAYAQLETKEWTHEHDQTEVKITQKNPKYGHLREDEHAEVDVQLKKSFDLNDTSKFSTSVQATSKRDRNGKITNGVETKVEVTWNTKN